jgi:hypothetical protein
MAKVTIPDLIAALQSSEPLLVWWSCWSLGRMEKEAGKALASLQTVVDKHKDVAVREAARTAIDAIKKATGK